MFATVSGVLATHSQFVPPRLQHRPWLPAIIVSLVCSLGAIGVVHGGWTDTDDGAGVVPLVALGSIGLASLRWRPAARATAIRPVSMRLSLVMNLASALVTTAVVAEPSVAPYALGPAVSLTVIGAYLALWGYRAIALLRTVSIMSLLTWTPVATFVHAVVRSSLEQPSDMLYQRLAQLPGLSVDDEPWRLFSAQLHRGSLVLIATIALSIGASRWRVSGRTVIDLALTVAAALVAHHLLILTTDLDQYNPSEVTALSTNPVLELAISVFAVSMVSAIRARRHRALGSATERANEQADAEAKAASVLEARDPVIFANLDGPASPTVVALLLTTIGPLVAVVIVG